MIKKMVNSKKYKIPKLNLKTGDKVKIIAGNHRGKSGEIISVDRQHMKATIKDINIKKKHVKPSTKHPRGGIISKEAPIHISNMMFLDTKSKMVTRIGRKLDSSDKLKRYSKKSGEFIE